jgi:hypothetical protein
MAESVSAATDLTVHALVFDAQQQTACGGRWRLFQRRRQHTMSEMVGFSAQSVVMFGSGLQAGRYICARRVHGSQGWRTRIEQPSQGPGLRFRGLRPTKPEENSLVRLRGAFARPPGANPHPFIPSPFAKERGTILWDG